MCRTLPIALFFFCAAAVRSQSSCPSLQTPAPDPTKLLFTPKQEMELGEIIRQQIENEFLVIDEDQVTAYLKRVGDRVAAHLPDSGLRYEFLLYDQPEIQAFGMPGGRIYVSRKIVAFLRNEDELAGLLGHELGHLAARQQALDMSRAFRDVLGLESLSADEDLYERYNQYLESVRLKKRSSQPQGDEDKSQKIADQLGVQAVARAGYSPQALPDFLDRLMQTKGKTGSWLSDMFGATRPDSRRLREALKDAASLPAACVEVKAPSKPDEFHQWQAAVLYYQGIGHPEHLNGVLARKQLNDPLRGDMSSRTRGGVWDLDKNARSVLIRGFQNAYYAPNAVFFLDFPEFEKDSRAMVVLSPVTKQLKDRQIDKDDDVTFFGDVFFAHET
jgi:hypothetical protein